MSQILTSVWQPEITDKTRIRPTAVHKFVLLQTKLKVPNIFSSPEPLGSQGELIVYS